MKRDIFLQQPLAARCWQRPRLCAGRRAYHCCATDWVHTACRRPFERKSRWTRCLLAGSDSGGACRTRGNRTDGRVQAIYIRTGGFLGFGARLVSVPRKISDAGQNVQLQLHVREMQKLPDVKDAG